MDGKVTSFNLFLLSPDTSWPASTKYDAAHFSSTQPHCLAYCCPSYPSFMGFVSLASTNTDRWDGDIGTRAVTSPFLYTAWELYSFPQLPHWKCKLCRIFIWKMGSPEPSPARSRFLWIRKDRWGKGKSLSYSRKPCLGSFWLIKVFLSSTPHHLPALFYCVFPYNKDNFSYMATVWSAVRVGDVFIKPEKKDATMTDLQNYQNFFKVFLSPPLVQQEVPFL